MSVASVAPRELAIVRRDLDEFITSGNAASSPGASRAFEALLDAVHASSAIVIMVSGDPRGDVEK